MKQKNKDDVSNIIVNVIYEDKPYHKEYNSDKHTEKWYESTWCNLLDVKKDALLIWNLEGILKEKVKILNIKWRY